MLELSRGCPSSLQLPAVPTTPLLLFFACLASWGLEFVLSGFDGPKFTDFISCYKLTSEMCCLIYLIFFSKISSAVPFPNSDTLRLTGRKEKQSLSFTLILSDSQMIRPSVWIWGQVPESDCES